MKGFPGFRYASSGLLLLALNAAAGDFNATLALAPEWRGAATGSAYYVAPPLVAPQHRALRSDLELRYRDGGLDAQATLRNAAREGAIPQQRGILNQLYYDGEIAPGSGYTVGKKVLAWGVGFGFRPLDVVQHENRRLLNPPPQEGVPLLAWQRYSGATSLTVVWRNPGYGAADNDRDDPGIAANGYALLGGNDFHGVARASRRHRLEAGLGFARAVGEEWSLYAAALYQQRGWRTLDALAENPGALLAATDPLRESNAGPGFKGVAGAQWTGASGFGVLLEGWYDHEAWTRADWQRLDTLTASRRALAGKMPAEWINANLAWSSRAFTLPNLLRENLLLRISYDAENWKTYLEWLSTPRDGGLVTSIGAAWQGASQRVGFGLRRLGGAADSAYAHSPQSSMAFVEWRYAL
ncbi:MAG: hypothetical protein KGZ83_21510 [Sulfuricella sp.]|nr:hypothetical protein [Sulfuricella sp.]